MYDNTKLNIAMKNWLKSSCKKGFGEESAADLFGSFCDHCRRTQDMKRDPGRVVFGQQLKAMGFERRKRSGIAHWSGLTLKKPPRTKVPKHYKKTAYRIDKKIQDKSDLKDQRKQDDKQSHDDKLAEFKQSIKGETAKSARDIGQE